MTVPVALYLALTLLGTGPSFAGGEPDNGGTSSAAPPTIPERAVGTAGAPVRMDLYASFASPQWAEWHLATMPPLITEYIETGRVRIVFHDLATVPAYPSVKAAMIGLCTPTDRFLDVIQSFAAGHAAAQDDEAAALRWYEDAKRASGLPPEVIEACSNSEPTYELVRAQMQDPVVQTLTQLPGLLINGIKLDLTDWASIEYAINLALADAIAAPSPAVEGAEPEPAEPTDD